MSPFLGPRNLFLILVILCWLEALTSEVRNYAGWLAKLAELVLLTGRGVYMYIHAHTWLRTHIHSGSYPKTIIPQIAFLRVHEYIGYVYCSTVVHDVCRKRARSREREGEREGRTDGGREEEKAAEHAREKKHNPSQSIAGHSLAYQRISDAR